MSLKVGGNLKNYLGGFFLFVSILFTLLHFKKNFIRFKKIMKFLYEKSEGSCGFPIKGLVSFAFCHYVIYGLFAVIFVFTNYCYPPLYYVDYLFGISGATLIGVSIVSWIFANMKKCQPMRAIMGFILLLNVLLIVVSTFYYTITRWNDIMVTSLVNRFRGPLTKDFPDALWAFLVVFACINGPILVFYMIYILSFMCNTWKSYLFTQPYQNYIGPAAFLPPMTMPAVPTNPSPTNKNP